MNQQPRESLLRTWARLWGVPTLDDVEIRITNRLSGSLGKCQPARGRISVSAALESNLALMREVLCHELAHVAVYRRFGRSAKPHGAEWMDFVKAAGYEPRVKHAASNKSARGVGRRYLHRCPVCHSTRYGGRPVPQWRCSECLDAGLAGVMTITEVSHKHTPES
jgi:hypothetical protein